MKIAKVIFREVSIPLNFQFAQSNNPSSHCSSSAILELHLEDGTIGYGEACPRTYVTGECMDSMQKDLQGIAPQFAQTELDHLESWRMCLRQWAAMGVGSSTVCALEMAGLDAISKLKQKPLASLLGLSEKDSEPILYSMVIPMLIPERLAKLLPRIQHLKPSRFKLKASHKLDNNLANIQLLRDFFGPAVSIRIDVNAGWNLDQAMTFIPAFLAHGVHSFEQPLPAKELNGLRQLTQTFGQDARIMVDESLLCLAGAKQILEQGSSNHFNLKISKLGGIFNTLAIYQLAAQYGVPCQLGAHFGETSLLTAAGILLAKMAGPMTAMEGALGAFLLKKDITNPSLSQAADGYLNPEAVLQQIGLAKAVDDLVLEQYTLRSRVYKPYKFNDVLKRLTA